jgi:SAM-dependent methyltransferase
MPCPSPALDHWRSQLAAWAIPAEILAAAPEPPWRLDPGAFAERADHVLARQTLTPSTQRALEALPDSGSVLDVGSGAGAASLPLMERARVLVAVDESEEMLAELRARVPSGISLTTVRGRWPGVADQVPICDVVVCHHVAYNLPDLDEAVEAMTAKARRRVVLELTERHPRSALNFLWPIFHGIDRPTGPTADDAVAVIRACGLEPRIERFSLDRPWLASRDLKDLVASVRQALCLGPDRDVDIETAALAGHLVTIDGRVGFPPQRLVTVWWDAS